MYFVLSKSNCLGLGKIKGNSVSILQLRNELTEVESHSLHEKCSYSVYGPEKLQIQTLFTQWLLVYVFEDG